MRDDPMDQQEYLVRSLDDLREQMTAGFSRMDMHFGRLNGRVGKAEARLDVLADRSDFDRTTKKDVSRAGLWGKGGVIAALLGMAPYVKDFLAEFWK